jgi:LmbE family N-acetylglucosaminyl deacetylase
MALNTTMLADRLAGAHVVVVTPHPDDESLAVGGLVQYALAHNATVSILQVTDGDNNPWPQRVLERRLRIGAVERRRWADRRSVEVAAAIAALGLPETSLQRMHWPDMGVGPRLREQGVAAIDAFAACMATRPIDVAVLPALGDGHPDHSASHVVACLALARLRASPWCLEYLIHGRDDDAVESLVVELDATMRARKRAAVLAHRSQVALSRRRLLARVGAREHLRVVPQADPMTVRDPRLPWRPPAPIRPWLHLTLAHAGGVHDWPWHAAPLRRDADGGWHLQLPDAVVRGPLFVRLETRLSSPWIFDHWGWHRLTPAAGLDQAVGGSAEPMP